MGNSFQDQLLKAGLVDEKKVQQAKKENHKKKKQGKNKKAVDENKLAAERARAQQAERDRELNLRRQEAMEKKAIAAQIKQLIETSRLPREDGENPYNFSDNGTVKKIYVTADQHRLLGRGKLAVVKMGEQYELVPIVAAEKIRQRDETVVIVRNETQQQDDEDDPYADYKVPDDLMW